MTFRLDRAVEVLAHIKASEPTGFNDDELIRPGVLGWNQGNWGDLVVDPNLPEEFEPETDEDGNTIFPGGVILTEHCGTAGCMAGWALFLSGVKQMWSRDREETNGERFVYDLIGTADGRDTVRFAVEWLGIPPDDEWQEPWTWTHWPRIFSPSNTFAELVAHVAGYAGVTVAEVDKAVEERLHSVKAALAADHNKRHVSEVL